MEITSGLVSSVTMADETVHTTIGEHIVYGANPSFFDNCLPLGQCNAGWTGSYLTLDGVSNVPGAGLGMAFTFDPIVVDWRTIGWTSGPQPFDMTGTFVAPNPGMMDLTGSGMMEARVLSLTQRSVDFIFSTPVAEPATVLLLAIACIAVMLRKREDRP